MLAYTPWSHRIAVTPPYCSSLLHIFRRPLPESSGATTTLLLDALCVAIDYAFWWPWVGLVATVVAGRLH